MVGILTAICFVTAIVLFLFFSDENWSKLWTGAFTRVGLLLSAVWFALPTRDRPAAWASVSPLTFVGLIVAVFVIARYPRIIIPAAIVLVIVGFVLRPRHKRRPKR